jgi:hypothetical protein
MAMVVLGLVVAVTAAVYSTWSPCGQSMLSTITPIGEQRRGARFAWTASWFALGALAGGFTLGGLAAGLAAAVRAADPTSGQVAGVAAFLAALTLASDLRIGGFRLPWHHRQVNELWLDRYRPWLYGVGFGWQIGCGFATYIMTAAVSLMVGLAALGASPAMALLVCASFGLVRGIAVFLGAGTKTPVALRAFHRRFDELAPLARGVAIAAEVLTLVVALGLLDRWFAVGVVVAGLVVALVAQSIAGVRRRRATSPDAPAVRGA